MSVFQTIRRDINKVWRYEFLKMIDYDQLESAPWNWCPSSSLILCVILHFRRDVSSDFSFRKILYLTDPWWDVRQIHDETYIWSRDYRIEVKTLCDEARTFVIVYVLLLLCTWSVTPHARSFHLWFTSLDLSLTRVVHYISKSVKLRNHLHTTTQGTCKIIFILL